MRAYALLCVVHTCQIVSALLLPTCWAGTPAVTCYPCAAIVQLVVNCRASAGLKPVASASSTGFFPSHPASVSGMMQDPHQPPVPSDDVDAAEWFPVAQLRGLKGTQLAQAGS